MTLQIDDPLDAIAVHAGGGMWGMLACAAFAAPNMVSEGRGGAWGGQAGASQLASGRHIGLSCCIAAAGQACATTHSRSLHPLTSTFGPAQVTDWYGPHPDSLPGQPVQVGSNCIRGGVCQLLGLT